MKNDFQTGKAAGLIRINQTFIFKEIHMKYAMIHGRHSNIFRMF